MDPQKRFIPNGDTKMAQTFTYPAKITRPEGVYKVTGGWKHSKDCGRVWEDETGCATDYRFCCERERGHAGR